MQFVLWTAASESSPFSSILEINSVDLENVLVMEKVAESVGKARNYGPTARDLEEERRRAEIRLREKEEAHQTEAKSKKEEEAQRDQEQEERVRTHTTPWNERDGVSAGSDRSIDVHKDRT